MAEIVSLSLSPELKEQLDTLQKEYGFKGRSEALRAGLQMLLSEKSELPKTAKPVEALLMVSHKEKATQELFSILHDSQHLVRTQLHQHLENHKCLEIFFLNGKGSDIEKLVKKLRITRNIDLVKLVSFS